MASYLLINLMSLYGAFLVLAGFIVKPSILPYGVAQKFIGHPIYAQYSHALAHYKMALVGGTLLFLALYYFLRKIEFIMSGKLWFFVGIIISLSLFYGEQWFNFVRLSEVSSIPNFLMYRLLVLSLLYIFFWSSFSVIFRILRIYPKLCNAH